jgi:hypothetical protein
MLYNEIIAVCSQIHTKHINTQCGYNVEFVNVKLVVHIVSTGLWKVTALYNADAQNTFWHRNLRTLGRRISRSNKRNCLVQVTLFVLWDLDRRWRVNGGRGVLYVGVSEWRRKFHTKEYAIKFASFAASSLLCLSPSSSPPYSPVRLVSAVPACLHPPHLPSRQYDVQFHGTVCPRAVVRDSQVCIFSLVSFHAVFQRCLQNAKTFVYYWPFSSLKYESAWKCYSVQCCPTPERGCFVSKFPGFARLSFW